MSERCPTIGAVVAAQEQIRKELSDWLPSDMVARILRAAYAVDESAVVSARSCPCEWTTPCSQQCTCANSTMSGGCSRCCKYGSEEQRRGMAEYLAGGVSARVAHDRDLSDLWGARMSNRDALAAILRESPFWDKGGAWLTMTSTEMADWLLAHGVALASDESAVLSARVAALSDQQCMALAREWQSPIVFRAALVAALTQEKP